MFLYIVLLCIFHLFMFFYFFLFLFLYISWIGPCFARAFSSSLRNIHENASKNSKLKIIMVIMSRFEDMSLFYFMFEYQT